MKRPPQTDRRLKMKVKIFERSGEPGRLAREINDFLATLGPGAVLNTQTAIAAVRNENEQIETEYVVTIGTNERGRQLLLLLQLGMQGRFLRLQICD